MRQPCLTGRTVDEVAALMRPAPTENHRAVAFARHRLVGRETVADQEQDARRATEQLGGDLGADPTWTVIEIATGRDLGTYDSEAEIALCLAFEKLARDEVEVLCDASLMATMIAM